MGPTSTLSSMTRTMTTWSNAPEPRRSRPVLPDSDRVCAVVAAAGSGTRLGFDQPKAFVSLGERTLLERSLDNLVASECFGRIVVVVAPHMLQRAQDLLAQPANQALWGSATLTVITAEGERADSVAAGLAHLERKFTPTPRYDEAGDTDESGEANDAEELDSVPADVLVAVHDAARCLVPPAMVADTIAIAARGVAAGIAQQDPEAGWAGAIPVVPVADTIKIGPALAPPAAESEARPSAVIQSTPDRSQLHAAQTPQVFSLAALLEATRRYAVAAEMDSAHPTGRVGAPLPVITDDASLMEWAGYPVLMVQGDRRAMKITTREDYWLAELLVGQTPQPQPQPQAQPEPTATENE